MAEAPLPTGRVRPMVESDLPQLLAWRNDEAVRAAMFSAGLVQPEEHLRWFEAAAREGLTLLIFEAEGEPRGFVRFALGRHPRVADWGFYAAPGAPRGTGRALGRAALDLAFGPLGLHKICGEVLESNPRSVALHRALGFVQEGKRAEHHFDGSRFQAVLCFGLLARQWYDPDAPPP